MVIQDAVFALLTTNTQFELITSLLISERDNCIHLFVCLFILLYPTMLLCVGITKVKSEK